ncbi:DUF488 domain-containing protein [Leifsonia aquatica]|uniref:DUF488 domain-containing protein n=1 Tax=Leifsonia aquatica TaxID=144185 RepID=UPI0004693AD3|nr:DUF488 family protein [Leifsonia aquatica]
MTAASDQAGAFRVRRVYDAPSRDDGFRVLVDRLWPRGLSKERAELDLWLKDVAPSTALRQWFHQGNPPFEEFRARYEAELADNPAVAQLRELAREHPVVTLLVGARDAHNHGVVLEGVLEHHP